MRLGAELDGTFDDPDRWIAALRERGYDAAIFPLDGDPPLDLARALAEAARRADVLIAEVGAWSNPLHPDPDVRREKIELCRRRLALADEIGARCCVNVAGSRGEDWLWAHPLNYAEHTFDLVVESLRSIVDAVKPRRTFYTVETMPWMVPDSPQAYLKLLEAVDRPAVAVHLDVANMMNCPSRYLANADFIRECFDLLAPRIKSCHAKDVILERELTVMLREVPPGKGGLDYRTYLRCLDRLGPDAPLLIEEFGDAAHRRSAEYLRALAAEVGVAGRAGGGAS